MSERRIQEGSRLRTFPPRAGDSISGTPGCSNSFAELSSPAGPETHGARLPAQLHHLAGNVSSVMPPLPPS